MLRKSYFANLTKAEIYSLRGGQKHNFLYFVGIYEGDILTDVSKRKLLGQMGSQRTQFPAGYEPLKGADGISKLDLAKMTMPISRLRLIKDWPNYTPAPRIDKRETRPACILRAKPGTEAFAVLSAEAELFEIRHRIRRHAERGLAQFELILDLMKAFAGDPLCEDPAERFEIYLRYHSLPFWGDLLRLLEMPESPVVENKLTAIAA